MHRDERVYRGWNRSWLSAPLCAVVWVVQPPPSIMLLHTGRHHPPTAPTADCTALCFTADTTEALRSLGFASTPATKLQLKIIKSQKKITGISPDRAEIRIRPRENKIAKSFSASGCKITVSF